MKLEVEKGLMFYQVVKLAQQKAVSYQTTVDFVFNDIHIRVDRDSFIDDICTIYDLKCKIQQLENQ
jgi:hypothetical protein